MTTIEAETETLPPHMRVDAEFAEIWNANDMEGHPILSEAIDTIQQQIGDPGEASTVYFTDVTLRDGQQQETDPVTTEQRLNVFDNLVKTGIDRIEIGHLGNKEADQELAKHIVKRVAEKESEGDEDYANVKLQVLFGSDKQERQTKEGIAVLRKAFESSYGEDWEKAMADKVVVHVYDRIDPNLTQISQNPYDARKSAHQVANSAQFALDAGFKNFSVSAEAATAVTPEEAIQFYRSVNKRLIDQGAESVNVNLANTYGYSKHNAWNAHTLAVFNYAVKAGFSEGKISTSIHTHNDRGSAADISMDALTAGFDRVEGTLVGMGERDGNVALVDVAGRQLEQAALAETGAESPMARKIGSNILQRTVKVSPAVAEHLGNWHSTGDFIAQTFGEKAQERWQKTSLGSPDAHNNGSGPHDQAMLAAVENPVNFPPYKNYEWTLAPNGVMGRPDAEDIAVGDPKAVIKVTVANHAGGGSTSKIVNGEYTRAEPQVVEEARDNFHEYKASLVGRVATGIVLTA